MIDAAITFLRVADIGRSRRFYDRLGLELVLDQGTCLVYRVAAGGFLGVCERADPGSTGVVFTFVTDDVARWHERLVAAGAGVDGPPRDNAEYRIHHFFATDPDDNLLEVQRFWDAGWAGP